MAAVRVWEDRWVERAVALEVMVAAAVLWAAMAV